MTRRTAPRAGVAASALIACGLSACQSGGGSLFGGTGSPAGQPIALESIEGAPAAVRTALTGELASAASARKVEIVGNAGEARYRVRGYLTTERSADGGTALAFVWDVFDAQQRRAQRLTGSTPIQLASSRTAKKNPWDGLDKEALARLAERSMDEIAGFLSAPRLASATPVESSSDGVPIAN